MLDMCADGFSYNLWIVLHFDVCCVMFGWEENIVNGKKIFLLIYGLFWLSAVLCLVVEKMSQRKICFFKLWIVLDFGCVVFIWVVFFLLLHRCFRVWVRERDLDWHVWLGRKCRELEFFLISIYGCFGLLLCHVLLGRKCWEWGKKVSFNLWIVLDFGYGENVGNEKLISFSLWIVLDFGCHV